ncbi:hypothetical protein LP419_36625 [Massilia sp. H-1]|nr:hypothetical protein LP419_36625 [Massilia sp. H-1]
MLAKHPDLFEAAKLSDQAQADWLAPFQAHRMALLTAKQEEQLMTEGAQFWTDTALTGLYSAFSGPKLGSFHDDPFGLFAAGSRSGPRKRRCVRATACCLSPTRKPSTCCCR